MEETEAKSKPWQWPAEWARDQSFYRDIATRTVSGILVVAIGYLFAVFMGYIQSPGFAASILPFVSAASIVLWIAVGITVLLRFVGIWIYKSSARRHSRRDWPPRRD